jgi:hypothetical protein
VCLSTRVRTVRMRVVQTEAGYQLLHGSLVQTLILLDPQPVILHPRCELSQLQPFAHLRLVRESRIESIEYKETRSC